MCDEMCALVTYCLQDGSQDETTQALRRRSVMPSCSELPICRFAVIKVARTGKTKALAAHENNPAAVDGIR